MGIHRMAPVNSVWLVLAAGLSVISARADAAAVPESDPVRGFMQPPADVEDEEQDNNPAH